jgi:cob(I)alamin adenosyltransferase
VRRVSHADVADLEGQIDAATAQLPPLKRFILPGGSLTAAHLHVARAVCRRAERQVAGLALGGAEAVGEYILVYLNRLSDLVFVLARLANKLEGTADTEWRGKVE